MPITDELEAREKAKKIIDNVALVFNLSREDHDNIIHNELILWKCSFKHVALEKVFVAIQHLFETKPNNIPKINELLKACEAEAVKSKLYSIKNANSVVNSTAALPACPIAKYSHIWDNLLYQAHFNSVAHISYYANKNEPHTSNLYINAENKICRHDWDWRNAVKKARLASPSLFKSYQNCADRFLEQALIACAEGFLILTKE